MLTRLFQRAGAIGAASVALFVCLVVPAHANTAPQVNVYGVDTVSNADGHFEARYHFQRRFASNDPVYPGKVDYVTRTVKVKKRGNPLQWFKKNPIEAAAAAAVASAGFVIDELTNQVVSVNQIPVDWDGYIYRHGQEYPISFVGNWRSSFDAAANDAPPSVNDLDGHTWTKSDVTVIRDPDTSSSQRVGYIGYHSPTSPFKTFSLDINAANCSNGAYASLPQCQNPDEIFKTETEPVSDSDVWWFLNPIANDAPAHHLDAWAKDRSGNPFIYPEVQAEQAKIAQSVPGAERLPDAVVVTDPLAGQGLGPDGYPTGDPVPTPDVITDDAPIEFPTDYAREQTLTEQRGFIEEIRDYAADLSEMLAQDFDEQPPIDGDNPADSVYVPLTDQFDDLPDLPGGIPTVGDFGINSGSVCQQVTFNWMGASVDFPSSSQCDKLDSAKQILGWFIYVCTFFGCVYTILGARSQKS